MEGMKGNEESNLIIFVRGEYPATSQRERAWKAPMWNGARVCNSEEVINILGGKSR